MVTDKQLAANRQNALESTGPRTLEGKAKASKNALKHGLLSSEVLLEDESREKFEEFGERLLADLSPKGELECMLADRIIAACWRLRRTVRIEREMMAADLDQGVSFGPKFSDTHSTLGRCVAMDMAKPNTYGKLCRYETPTSSAGSTRPCMSYNGCRRLELASQCWLRWPWTWTSREYSRRITKQPRSAVLRNEPICHRAPRSWVR